ncbi:hypothetical protein BSL78_10761 [Apostichopus japonicus]|uniref:Fibronectin type-III domain-containing protein n=2 Tax=Stichopus japonicus TaxID=307972 RepID=A0A2G8KWI7_STIJA|nr:hypothetical protein BSL78_10761 [Apostichopus japonicus]
MKCASLCDAPLTERYIRDVKKSVMDILKKTADNYTTSPFINVQYQTVVMENWVTCTLGVFLALFCSRCESSGRFGQYSGSYVSHGEITKATAINLTCIALYGTRFTLSWKPVHEDSWNASLITSFVIKYSKRKDIEYSRPNRQTVITLIRTEWNAYEIDEVEPEENYMVIMSATRLNGPDLISNTIILNTGKDVPVGKWFILSIVMLLWVLAILHFLRTWRKKMTLRPTYDVSSNPRSPYEVMEPCHSNSYTYLHTQRSNSYTPELSHQSSGSNLHCSSKSHLSRSFNDLHTIIPEDMPTINDIPSSSGPSYCRT